MSTTSTALRALAEAYWAAEQRRDVDGVMALYHPDATYQDNDGLRRGVSELRGFYEGSVEAYPGLEVTIIREFPAPEGHSTAIEFDALLRDRSGQAWRILGMNVFECRDDLLVAVRSFEDRPVRVG